MEALKWIASVIGTIAGLCIAFGVGAIGLAFGAVFGTVMMVTGVIGFIAFAIKDYFESRGNDRAK